jgi:dynein light chain 4
VLSGSTSSKRCSYLLQGAAQLIKNTMDKKFGSTWHCIIGEGYGFDISCERRYLLHVYYGNIGILCYKC